MRGTRKQELTTNETGARPRRVARGVLAAVLTASLSLVSLPAQALAEVAADESAGPVAVLGEDANAPAPADGQSGGAIDVVDGSQAPGTGEPEQPIVPIPGDDGGALELEDAAETDTADGKDATTEEAIPNEDAANAQSSNAIASGKWGTCAWEINSKGRLIVGAGTGANSTKVNYKEYPWSPHAKEIKAVSFDDDVKLPKVCSDMFYGCTKLTSLDLSGWDTSGVTDMHRMFARCSKLSSLDLSGWNTSRVTNMFQMFESCSSLKSLDVSGWDTSRVTNIESIFDGCSTLKSLDLSSWNTSRAEEMFWMFDDCDSLASITVGSSYRIMDEEMFPDATSSNGKWWSTSGQKWYTEDQIVSRRSGVADTYKNVSGTMPKRKSNPITINAKKASVTVTYKPSSTSVTARNLTVSKAAGRVTYSNASTNATAKKFEVNKTSGKVTVPKGTKAGTYAVKVKATAAGNASYKKGSDTATYEIVVAKAKNPMVASAVARTVSYASVSAGNAIVERPIAISKQQGTLSYAKVSSGSSAALLVNKKDGRVGVRKGTARGTYTIKIKVTAAGNANYKAASKVVACKITVK